MTFHMHKYFSSEDLDFRNLKKIYFAFYSFFDIFLQILKVFSQKDNKENKNLSLTPLSH